MKLHLRLPLRERPPWRRRIIIFAVVVILMVVMSLPALALLLAVREEMSWRSGNHGIDRVWLVMERNERGVGWSSSRVEGEEHETVCIMTRVRFWLWRGSTPDLGTTYCECYRKNRNLSLEYLRAC